MPAWVKPQLACACVLRATVRVSGRPSLESNSLVGVPAGHQAEVGHDDRLLGRVGLHRDGPAALLVPQQHQVPPRALQAQVGGGGVADLELGALRRYADTLGHRLHVPGQSEADQRAVVHEPILSRGLTR